MEGSLALVWLVFFMLECLGPLLVLFKHHAVLAMLALHGGIDHPAHVVVAAASCDRWHYASYAVDEICVKHAVDGAAGAGEGQTGGQTSPLTQDAPQRFIRLQLR